MRAKLLEYQERMRNREQQAKEQKWFLIDPRTSNVMRNWDMVTSVALVFTAIFTPVEVGFMQIPENRWSDVLFLSNRLIDCVFIVDMAMQFMIMYPTSDLSSPTERWVTDRRKIAWHYLSSAWLPVDIISIGVSGFDIFAPTDGPLAKFKGFRAIRVLRLVKLVRLINASRIFKRWELRLSINYALLSIWQILFGLIFLCHLFACVWGLQASFDPMNSWLGPGGNEMCVAWDETTPCPAGQICNEEGYSCAPPGAQYTRSFYWAVATVTSIGYGDVSAVKSNEVEQLVCTAMMYCGAIFFAYIVGSFCGLASSLAPDKAQFRFDLSDLNWHMEHENIPSDLRYRLREYVHQTVHLRQGATRVRLLQLLSPGLAGEFALTMNQRWLKDVWWLNGVDGSQSSDLHVKLALELRTQVFPHNELVPRGSMYIVSGKGRALYAGHVLSLGQAFRTDEVLEIPGLRAAFPAVALSYLWTYSIAGERLREIIRESPRRIRQVIKKHQLNLAIRRTIVRAAEEDCAVRGVPFFGRSQYIYSRVEPATGSTDSLVAEVSPDATPMISQAMRRNVARATAAANGSIGSGLHMLENTGASGWGLGSTASCPPPTMGGVDPMVTAGLATMQHAIAQLADSQRRSESRLTEVATKLEANLDALRAEIRQAYPSIKPANFTAGTDRPKAPSDAWWNMSLQS